MKSTSNLRKIGSTDKDAIQATHIEYVDRSKYTAEDIKEFARLYGISGKKFKKANNINRHKEEFIEV